MDAKTQKIEQKSRRRFLSLCAMSAALAATPWHSILASTAPPVHHWSGVLLGAHVHMSLAHHDKNQANALFQKCVAEIKRLEALFTLYDSHSALSRLNKDKVLPNPAHDFVAILHEAQTMHAMTSGAFDITVKSLEEGADFRPLRPDDLEVLPQKIILHNPSARLTLNGIAQGYITDRITGMLKAEGLQNVLVQLGEARAIGSHPSGRPWHMALRPSSNVFSNISSDIVELDGNALATSEAISPNTGQPHIYNPKTGMAAQNHKHVSVIAQKASMADALSTAFMSMSKAQIQALHARYQQDGFLSYIVSS